MDPQIRLPPCLFANNLSRQKRTRSKANSERVKNSMGLWCGMAGCAVLSFKQAFGDQQDIVRRKSEMLH